MQFDVWAKWNECIKLCVGLACLLGCQQRAATSAAFPPLSPWAPLFSQRGAPCHISQWSRPCQDRGHPPAQLRRPDLNVSRVLAPAPPTRAYIIWNAAIRPHWVKAVLVWSRNTVERRGCWLRGIRGNQDGKNSYYLDSLTVNRNTCDLLRYKGHSSFLLILINHHWNLGKFVISWENFRRNLWRNLLRKPWEMLTDPCKCMDSRPMAASASTTRWCSAFLSLLFFLSVCPSSQTHNSPSLWLYRTVKGKCEEVTCLPLCFQSLHTKLPSVKNIHCLYAYRRLVLVKALKSFCVL